MTVHVFGHFSPDTDSTGSPIIWAWYLSDIKGVPAQANLLGEPNTEAAFMLKEWDLPKPAIIDTLADESQVVIVDTNNPAELLENINACDITAIIDHHKLVGGLETKGPIDITIRPLACTATIMIDLMGADAAKMPRAIKGAALSCILSDTLEFRSPTTTEHDKATAQRLAQELDIDLGAYAIRMDSKKYEVSGTQVRVSVLETTAPQMVLDRKDSLLASMADVAREDGVDEVLLFIVDILNEEATLLIPNDTVKTVAQKSFGATVSGDTVVLDGIMSRKKQIIPALTL